MGNFEPEVERESERERDVNIYVRESTNQYAQLVFHNILRCVKCKQILNSNAFRKVSTHRRSAERGKRFNLIFKSCSKAKVEFECDLNFLHMLDALHHSLDGFCKACETYERLSNSSVFRFDKSHQI